MSPKSLYLEINVHLAQDANPSRYLNEVYGHPSFSLYPFSMLHQLRNTEQSPLHHPEGNVWNHTMLVVDEAAKVKSQSQNPQALMWAALLHDIGKPVTTKRRKGKITSYDHDKAGAELSKRFLNEFTHDESFVSRVSGLVRYHMQFLFVLKDLPFADREGLCRNTEVKTLALLGFCDRMGRTHAVYEQEHQNMLLFLKKCGALEA